MPGVGTPGIEIAEMGGPSRPRGQAAGGAAGGGVGCAAAAGMVAL